MFRLLILASLLSLVAFGQKASNDADGRTTPVLVEIFTAEGCATCPNAERTLEFLRREQPVPGAEIVTLAFHVDYFDRFGWKDRFASREFTVRQELYAKRFRIGEIYTPQMVVDGRAEFSGTETGLATSAVLEAAKRPKGKIDLTLDGEVVKVLVSDLPRHKDAVVYFAITEDGLETEVSSGANRGRKLRHSSVVREFRVIGGIRKKELRFDAAIQMPETGPRRSARRLIAFVQETATGRVIGVGIRPDQPK